MGLANYRKLEVWKKSMLLVETAYQLTLDFPTDERFGLTSQLRRAAVSIPTNIAEGYGRLHRGDYVHHLSIAMGSVAEVETLLTLSARLQLVKRQRVLAAWALIQEVGRMLRRLIQSLHRDQRGEASEP